ncbi:MAG: type III-A CRISPR-associated RAMP protein Csm5 [Candidatus Zixiibacteriota bacterium]
MKQLEIKAKAITPIHFESGIFLTPLDFVIKNDIFYRIDFRKLSNNDHELFIKITDEIDKDNYKKAHKLLAENFDAEFAVYSAVVGPKVLKKYKKSNFSPDEKFHIMSLIRSDAPRFAANIPGSSIKGAIRTAYLSCQLEELDEQKRQEIIKFKGAPPGGISKYQWQEGKILDSLFRLPGKKDRFIFDKYNDPFEDFAVEDILLDKEYLEIAQILNTKLNRNGELQFGKEYLVEAIPSMLSTNPTNTEFDITIRLNKKSPIQTWDQLKSILDEYFLIEIRREINQLSMTSRFYWKDVAETLDRYQKDVDEVTALIRFGRYCGSNFTTVREFQKSPPKSRNIYDAGVPLGFVQLKILREIEI